MWPHPILISHFPGGLKYTHKSPRDLVKMQVLPQVYGGAQKSTVLEPLPGAANAEV